MYIYVVSAKMHFFFKKRKLAFAVSIYQKSREKIYVHLKRKLMFFPPKKEKLKNSYFCFIFSKQEKKFNHITKQCEIQADIVIIMDHYFKTHHHLSKREIEQG